MLRFVLSVSSVCVFGAWAAVVPTQASAWEAPAGSPPGWQPHWVQTQERADLFTDAVGDTTHGHAAANVYFRVDAPEQNGRLWVYNPAVERLGLVATREHPPRRRAHGRAGHGQRAATQPA